MAGKEPAKEDKIRKVVVEFASNPRKHLARRKFFRNRYEDEAAHNLMCSAKATLLNDFPFLGFVAIDLPLIEEKELNKVCGFKTAATDGYHIYYDAEFINKLSPAQVLFVVAHEIYHCVLNHTFSYGMMVRVNNTSISSKLWNIAADYVVNAYLIENGIGEKPTHPFDPLYKEEYSGWSVIEVYNDLMNDPETNSKLETLDQHVVIVFEGESSGGSEGSGEASMTKGEYEAKNDKFLEGIQKAITQLNSVPDFEKGAGSVPAFLRRYIEHFRESKVDWRTSVRNFLSSVMLRGYSYMRPNKKIQGGELILPGYRKMDKELKAIVTFDLSGSVGDESAGKFFSELKGLMKEFGRYSIHAVCFDAEVIEDSYQNITGDSKKIDMNFKKFMKGVSGGGGTVFQSIWDFIIERKLHNQAKVLIVFTDGYPCDTEWHKNRNVIPTIFITVGNENGWKAPFGKTIAYEEI